MKIFLICFNIILFFLAGKTYGQASATASFTASATIIQPIGITTTANMNFANLDARSGGAVILSPENTRISTGGVTLADNATVSAASFEVTGEEGFTFSLTLPEDEYVLFNGNEKMIIKDFTSSLGESQSLSGGSKVVRVGATLNVTPNQMPGVYNSRSSINITVNYN
ncbi:DUF4402 domain-containing protein [Salinimicrobium terrae]|uniref:DUF4402 domain-containing protein n=1 Tax=Salinimicrobium terrae TaxID=470866 RepID=UPI00041493FC|nr:DUF4402 domain-containing protein [Salinimicrobium terrae]